MTIFLFDCFEILFKYDRLKIKGELMKDYIFIISPSAVGKTTLAKSLYNHYKSVYIEQNMVPEFNIPQNVDEGIFEEKICWENTLQQIKFFS